MQLPTSDQFFNGHTIFQFTFRYNGRSWHWSLKLYKDWVLTILKITSLAMGCNSYWDNTPYFWVKEARSRIFSMKQTPLWTSVSQLVWQSPSLSTCSARTMKPHRIRKGNVNTLCLCFMSTPHSFQNEFQCSGLNLQSSEPSHLTDYFISYDPPYAPQRQYGLREGVNA